MASSFRYPPQLLHSYTESQWLPPAADQQSSSLDRLEEEERATIERLKSRVLPEIPDPIGVDESKKFALTAQQSAVADADADSILMLGGREQPFWQKYKEQITKFNHGKESNQQAVDDTDQGVSEARATLAYGARLSRYRLGDGYQVKAKTGGSMLAASSSSKPQMDSTQPQSMPPPSSLTPNTASNTPPGASAGPADQSNTSSMMSFSHDDTTFDQDDDDDDEDMEED